MRCGWATVHPVEIVISRCRIHFWEGVPIAHCTAFWKCCIWHNPNAGDIGLLIYSSHFSHQPGKLSERRNFVRLGIHDSGNRYIKVEMIHWISLDLIGGHQLIPNFAKLVEEKLSVFSADLPAWARGVVFGLCWHVMTVPQPLCFCIARSIKWTLKKTKKKHSFAFLCYVQAGECYRRGLQYLMFIYSIYTLLITEL